MQHARLTFDSPPLLIVAAVLAAGVIAIAWRRRIALPLGSKVLAVAGLLLLVLAAGLPHWRRAVAQEVAVLVDLSPSTRSAAFRERSAVERRARELLGATPFRIYRFAGGSPVPDAPQGSDAGDWAELPTPATQFQPPAAARVLLFSDGRFDLPASAPPTYAVIDPSLAQATDGRVASLTIDGRDAVAGVAVDTSRSFAWTIGEGGAGPTAPIALQPGTVVLRRTIADVSATNPSSASKPSSGNAHGAAVGPTATRGASGAAVGPTATRGASGASTPIMARLSPGDLWPENDALSIVPPPPPKAQRWFVTRSADAPAGYRRLSPGELPGEAPEYLAASAIVLDNISAAALPPVAADRLTQFVRDLGGGLVIAGGDDAFAAGGYVGTAIDALSPLASAPPRPAAHWMLLTDGSGSMNAPSAGDAGPLTRWQSAAAALVKLLPAIPPDDPVDLGSFADDITWWTGAAARPAKEVQSLPLPPAGVAPGGATNLRPALEAAARRHDPALPGTLLLLSDADAEVGDVPSLVELFKARNVTLHLLAVGDGRGLADLRRVVEQTGGTVVTQRDADRWADAAADLLRSAREKHLIAGAADVRFTGALSALPPRRISPWNRTWLRPRATLLAETTPADDVAGDATVPLAAMWQAGEGRVTAMGFAANDAERAAAVELVAAPPRDPRINIIVTPGGMLRVQVDAIDPQAAPAERFINGLMLSLELSPADGGGAVRTEPIPQTAPGRYQVLVAAPARPMLATVRDAGRAVDRFAVAGRYPTEFDAIGINRENLQRLIERFGGAVVEPSQTKPIDFKWDLQATAIAPWLAAAGALALAGSLLWWRWA